MSFWTSIDKALETIINDQANTFDAVRDILHTHGDPEYPQPCTIDKRADHAFFAGSGGDKPLRTALHGARWVTVWSEAGYYYVMMNRSTGEFLTYIEGDVMRGVTSSVAHGELIAQADLSLTFTFNDSGRLLSATI